MATQSQSLAFEPSMAVDADKENHPIINGQNEVEPVNQKLNTHKEVHFSPVPPLASRTVSLDTHIPLLETVSSASQLPRQAPRSKSVSSQVDIDAYIQQSQSLLDTQRLNFERERKLFSDERKLWNAERAILKSRITELEGILSKDRDRRRRFSNEGTKPSTQSFATDFGRPASFSSLRGAKPRSHQQSIPIWERPEHTTPVTRVFTHEEPTFKSDGHLPSIRENESFPSLDREISPTSVPVGHTTGPVPIDQIDPKLDGITLKSTALAPSFVSRVVASPPNITPQRTPSPTRKSPPQQGLNVTMDGLLSPLDAKLKLYAGHTPMALGSYTTTDSASKQTTENPTPLVEHPVAPAPTARRPPYRPNEGSDSYFSTTDLRTKAGSQQGKDQLSFVEDSDPALQEPLTLPSNSEAGKSDVFLDQLDAKLLMEAKKYTTRSPEYTSPDDDMSQHRDDSGGSNNDIDEEGPRLKMKKSTNFGSAYGSKHCGNF